jgi:hypothetical protein
MTNPRTLLLSIAATACGFILTLVGVAGPVPVSGEGAVGAAIGPGLVSALAQDASRFDPVTFAVAREPAASGPAPALDAADRDDGPDPLHGRARRP